MTVEEVEAVIRTHRAIREVVVTDGHAVVTFVENDVVSWAELIAFCGERLPASQVPSSFEVDLTDEAAA